jgi:hypothetical protein
MNVTWNDLVRTDPRLAGLLIEVRQLGATAPRFCGVSAWYGYGSRDGGVKARLYRLAGFGSNKPELRTREAYEVALETLYAALPPCRGCACVADRLTCEECYA